MRTDGRTDRHTKRIVDFRNFSNVHKNVPHRCLCFVKVGVISGHCGGAILSTWIYNDENQSYFMYAVLCDINRGTLTFSVYFFYIIVVMVAIFQMTSLHIHRTGLTIYRIFSNIIHTRIKSALVFADFLNEKKS
jgi:hypothetical protein